MAKGNRLLVRLFVPLWVVNASALPVFAAVVGMQPPPKPAAQDAAASEPGALIDAAKTIRLQVMETRAADRRRVPPSSQDCRS